MEDTTCNTNVSYKHNVVRDMFKRHYATEYVTHDFVQDAVTGRWSCSSVFNNGEMRVEYEARERDNHQKKNEAEAAAYFNILVSLGDTTLLEEIALQSQPNELPVPGRLDNSDDDKPVVDDGEKKDFNERFPRVLPFKHCRVRAIFNKAYGDDFVCHEFQRVAQCGSPVGWICSSTFTNGERHVNHCAQENEFYAGKHEAEAAAYISIFEQLGESSRLQVFTADQAYNPLKKTAQQALHELCQKQGFPKPIYRCTQNDIKSRCTIHVVDQNGERVESATCCFYSNDLSAGKQSAALQVLKQLSAYDEVCFEVFRSIQPKLWLKQGTHCDYEENSVVEFKGGEFINSPCTFHTVHGLIVKQLGKYLSGWLNMEQRGGGEMFLGIHDKGVVQGVWLTSSERDELQRLVHNLRQLITPSSFRLQVNYLPVISPALTSHIGAFEMDPSFGKLKDEEGELSETVRVHIWSLIDHIRKLEEERDSLREQLKHESQNTTSGDFSRELFVMHIQVSRATEDTSTLYSYKDRTFIKKGNVLHSLSFRDATEIVRSRIEKSRRCEHIMQCTCHSSSFDTTNSKCTSQHT